MGQCERCETLPAGPSQKGAAKLDMRLAWDLNP